MHVDLSKAVGVRQIPGWRPRMAAVKSGVMAYSDWTHYAIPTDNQHNLPACAGFATANWIECMIRKRIGHDAIPRGRQIDGESIWRKARQMFWAHEPVGAGGIYVEHGLKAAIVLGILPPDTQIVSSDMDIGQLAATLRCAPVIQGTNVWSGWNHADRTNGQIPDDAERGGGHATCIVGVLEQDGQHFVLFQNSWGGDWGLGGYGVLTRRQWSDALLAPLVTATLPWYFNEWVKWREYLR